MQDKTRVIIAILCGFIVFIYLFITKIIQKKSWKSKLIETAKKNNCIVDGICVDTKHIPGDLNSNSQALRFESVKVKYEYIVNGKKYYKKLRFQDAGISVKFPYKITIYYNKNNPRQNVSNVDSNTLELGCFITIAITILTIIIISNLLRLI